jgi:hypothetical protein
MLPSLPTFTCGRFIFDHGQIMKQEGMGSQYNFDRGQLKALANWD